MQACSTFAACALLVSTLAAAAHSVGVFAVHSPPSLWLAGSLALAAVLAPALARTLDAPAHATQRERNAFNAVAYATAAACIAIVLSVLALASALPLALATGTFGVLTGPALVAYLASVTPFHAQARTLESIERARVLTSARQT